MRLEHSLCEICGFEDSRKKTKALPREIPQRSDFCQVKYVTSMTKHKFVASGYFCGICPLRQAVHILLLLSLVHCHCLITSYTSVLHIYCTRRADTCQTESKELTVALSQRIRRVLICFSFLYTETGTPLKYKVGTFSALSRNVPRVMPL
jgi:hypothetical protein